MNYKIGDEVICIKEDDLSHYIGTIWKVIGFDRGLIYCENTNLYDPGHIRIDIIERGFPFCKDEIALASSLIKELI